MVAAGGVDIHLLKQIKVRLLPGQKGRDGIHIGCQALLTPRPRLRTAIHEKAVVILVGAKTDIIGKNGIALPCCQLRRGGIALRRQLHVANAVIINKNIGHVCAHHQHECQHDA